MDKKMIAVPLVCQGHSRPVMDLFYSPVTPDGFFLISASKGDVFHSFEHKHIVRACAFCEDTHLLLTGGIEKILRIYDLDRPDAPPREVDKPPGSIRTVSWMHSDQTISSSCTDMGGVRLWDVRSGKIVQTLDTKSPVTSAEVSQDGRYITTADGSIIKFWDANP